MKNEQQNILVDELVKKIVNPAFIDKFLSKAEQKIKDYLIDEDKESSS